MKSNTTNLPLFDLAVIGLSFSFLLSVFLFYRSTKSKEDFTSSTGVVEYIGSAPPFIAAKNPAKFRYLKISSYPLLFELFTGKDAGDFKPEVEKLDDLKKGDTVVVYYDELFASTDQPVNRLAYFVEKNKAILFAKGSWEKYLAFFMAGFCLLMGIWVVRLFKKGKIR